MKNGRQNDPDKGRVLVHYHKFPIQLHDFIVNNFGNSTNINVVLATFYLVKFGNAIFDDKFLYSDQGFFDAKRTQAWHDIRVGKYNIRDVSLLVYGDADAANGISEEEQTIEKFREWQEKRKLSGLKRKRQPSF